ncbi:MAG: UDP-N-acetylmuramoyl-L-alanine--D-glutamate ligase [Planctomycetes bacterium]|nr:UDP-N-acetylmuramoyl-L-alanine--D-glutamate ligase [Planctomycetota bacterium]
MTDLKDKRVLVMGLGRFGGGVGVTRWLHGGGAAVTVTDRATADELAASLAQLDGLDLAFRLGGHDEADLDGCDLLVVNPAVPLDAPLLEAARRRGVAMTTEINLFLQHCPAPIVGITGSVGKSTTAAMAAAILATARRTHLGGNIGRSLLTDLADGSIGPRDVVVLELSSFQLEWTPVVGLSPSVALVTNLVPNHLDRHGTLEAYGAAKKNIFRYQAPEDALLLPAGDATLAPWADEAPGRVRLFGGDEPFALRVPGPHNQRNAQAAWAIGKLLGIGRADAQTALVAFEGLPNRLALVAERRGVRYYDDSKATTPDGALVALASFDAGRIVAIVGGYDKHIPLDALADALAARCKAVIATGAVGPQVAALVEARRRGCAPEVVSAPRFDDAVRAAQAAAASGDVVLLSPACASYDQFANYIARGERFAQLVRTLV